MSPRCRRLKSQDARRLSHRCGHGPTVLGLFEARSPWYSDSLKVIGSPSGGAIRLRLSDRLDSAMHPLAHRYLREEVCPVR
jgi:hypothetical protein